MVCYKSCYKVVIKFVIKVLVIKESKVVRFKVLWRNYNDKNSKICTSNSFIVGNVIKMYD